MKKKGLHIAMAMAMLIALVFAVTGCFAPKDNKDVKKAEEAQNKHVENTEKASESSRAENEEEKEEKGTSTLMIYMMGSDLESRSGAGTSDLEELENSGIDTDSVNVVVYCGGAPRWQNDMVTKDENAVLLLTKKGFKAVEGMGSVSMGEADCLKDFLNYAHKNYPADNYALVLWNHGNGPVMGYGKDMLFDNDSLTLAEMKTAMASSPFKGENKLEWVGFDACLMASAELSCIWAPYADYLVASQEIEPAFGWNYDVFKSYGNTDTAVFLKKLIDGYMDACEAYYDKKGYDDRDTTLSCVALWYADELHAAMNALFEKAYADAGAKYNTFAQKRVETRALGRASTGSEYDLIDVKDMAEKLGSVYEEEAQALCNVIDKMVIKNGTNTQGCSGMSIYYPFYNKYYFEKSWREVYSDLGVFESYGEYLDAYEKVWLDDDKFLEYAQSLTPEVAGEANRSDAVITEDGTVTYMLKLNPEQQENYADAKFYILRHIKGDAYQQVMSSENVINRDGVLYANFDGKAIYVKNNFGERFLPVVKEYDTVGNVSRYTAMTTNIFDNTGDILDFHLSLDNSTDQVSMRALLPHVDTSEDILAGGKLEEYSLDYKTGYQFIYGDFSYVTRYDNGVIKPIAQWYEENGKGTIFTFYTKDGINFVYEALEPDMYYIIYEITDTQGSKYCSELLMIDGVEYSGGEYTVEKNTIDWSEGDSVLLASEENVEVYLKKVIDCNAWENEALPTYKLEVINKNDFAVSARFENILVNDKLYVDYIYAIAPAKGEAKSYDGVIRKDDVKIGGISEVSSIGGSFEIKRGDYSTLVPKKHIRLNIKGDASLTDLEAYYGEEAPPEPIYGARAEKQVLFETEAVRATLLYFGKGDRIGTGCIYIENFSDEFLELQIDAACVNGVTFDLFSTSFEVGPKGATYDTISTFDANLAQSRILEIESLKLHYALYELGTTVYFVVPKLHGWADVKLCEKGKAKAFTMGENLVYDENGVKVVVDSYEENDAECIWKLTVINDSDEDITLYATDENGDDFFSSTVYNPIVGKHQRSHAEIRFYGAELVNKIKTEGKINVRFNMFDFYESETLYTAKNVTELIRVDLSKPEAILCDWSEGNRVKIAEKDDVSVYLKKAGNLTYNIKEEYAIEVENSNNFPVYVTFDKTLLNGICIGDTYVSVNANSTALKKLGSSLYDLIYTGALDEVTAIEGILKIRHAELSGYVITEDEKIVCSISSEAVISLKENGAWAKFEPVKAHYGALAEKQVLWETENIRVTLLGLGESEDLYRVCYLCYENLGDEPIYADIYAVEINGATCHYTNWAMLPVGAKAYQSINLKATMADLGEEEIETLSFNFGIKKSGTTSKNPIEHTWAKVELCEKGKAEKYTETGEVIYEGNGIKVLLNGVIPDPTGTKSPIWSLTVINNTGEGIMLGDNLTQFSLNGYSQTAYRVNSNNDQIGPHQRTTVLINHEQNLYVDSLTVKLRFFDFYGDKVVFESDEIVLKAVFESNN